MAILLFMVCAVIGGIILAAATAAAGRISQMAEMDKRYFNVTSAAELLAHKLEDQEVTIDRTKTYTVTTNEYGVESGTPSDVNYAVYLDGTEYNGTAGNFLADCAVNLLSHGTSSSNEAMFNASYDYITEVTNTALSVGTSIFSLTFEDQANQKLETIECTASVLENGTLEIVMNGDSYQLKLTMVPNYAETQIDDASDAVPVGVDGSTQVTKTITKSSVISWTVSSIETIMSEAETTTTATS